MGASLSDQDLENIGQEVVVNERQKIRDSLATAKSAAGSLPEGSDRESSLLAVNAYGSEFSDNGVTIDSRQLDGNTPATHTFRGLTALSDGKFMANLLVTFDPDVQGEQRAIDTGHEGRHLSDYQSLVNQINQSGESALSGAANITHYQLEMNGYTTSSNIARGLNWSNLSYSGNLIWNRNWKSADIDTLRRQGIENHLRSGHRPNLTPQNVAGSRRLIGN